MEARPLETIHGETAVKTPDRVTSDVPKTKPATAKNLAVLLLEKD